MERLVSMIVVGVVKMSVAELLNTSKIPCVGCAWLCILNLYSMIFAVGLQVCGIFVLWDEYTREV